LKAKAPRSISATVGLPMGLGAPGMVFITP
jgi:hypothetical protein